jgi:hypothetical protein
MRNNYYMSVYNGNIAELQFLLETTKKGGVVSRPQIQSTIYDFIVDNGNRVLKVQVKSCFSEGPNYGVSVGRGGNSKIPYEQNEIDIFAIFIAESFDWYFIPVSEINGAVKITLYPDSESKWNKFKNGWIILLN